MLYQYIVKDNDMFGRDILRSKESGTPLAYRPTLEHATRQSANKHNNNQTIDSIVPVVRLVDGLAVSTDSWKATFKFSALQHIEDPTGAELAFEALIQYVTANKAVILAGGKPAGNDDLTVTIV